MVLEHTLFVRLMPRPDAIVVLQAPAPMLYARKHEHTIEILDRWSKAYADVFGAMGGVIVGTDRDIDAASGAVAKIVWDTFSARHGWQPTDERVPARLPEVAVAS
jgi:hypothetical protein